MGVIDDFLKKEDDAYEARKYREKIKEFSDINKTMDEIKREEIIKKEFLKQKLKGLGVNIIERNERK